MDQSTNRSYYAQLGGSISASWHHLVIVHDGTKYQIYLDGSALTTIGSTSLMTSQQIIIGMRSDSSSFFDGKIDEVAIWSSALSEETIQAIYDTTANNPGKVADLSETPEGAPAAWYRMGD